MHPATLRLWPVPGIGEIAPGDDLAEIIVAASDGSLTDGDVVVVTSKIVSKAAGLVTSGEREDLVASQTDRVVARRGLTRIVRTHHGLTMAAGGVDASNTPLGTVVVLPPEPDRDASQLRRRIESLTGAVVGVVVTDTAGRAWREGQTDFAIGVAGITPSVSFAGGRDGYGNVLAVTEPAIADEIAAAADLVAGKLGGTPVVIVRGLSADWLLDEDGDGASALIRAEANDLFGFGSVDAVLAAVGHADVSRGFPMPLGDPIDRLVEAARAGTELMLADVRVRAGGVLEVYAVDGGSSVAASVAMGVLAERLRIIARALRLDVQVRLAATDE